MKTTIRKKKRTQRTKKETAPARRRRSRAPQPQKVILSGPTSSHRQVAPLLAKLGLLVDEVADAPTAAEAVDGSTVAVVLGLERGSVSGPAGIRKILRSVPGGQMPVFALVQRNHSARNVQRMYEEGATAVLEWPKEALTFSRLFRDLVAVERDLGKPSREDRSLARALQARMDLAFEPKRLKVSVDDGTAVVRGVVESLKDRRRIEQVLDDVPGVQGISTEAVTIASTTKSDRSLAADARTLLRKAAAIDETTLSVGARDGYVILTGTVASRRELERAIDVLSSLEGTLGITNLTTISPRQKRIDHRRRTRAQRAVDGLLPKEAHVDVKVFGPVAVVTGDVPVLKHKRQAARIVQDQLPIERVVNKISVRSA